MTTRDAPIGSSRSTCASPGRRTQTVGATGGRIYDVAYLQLFQADQIRGVGGTTNPRAGRRVLAQ